MQDQRLQYTDLTVLYEKLRISEEQFRGAFEYAAIGMAIVATDGKWIQVNRSLCKMLGYSAREMRKLTFQDLTHPHDLNKDLNYVNKLIRGKAESYKIEKRYFHKNGDVLNAILSVSIVRDQYTNPLHFVSQIVDITEIRKAECRLETVLEVTSDQNNRLLNFAQIVSHNLRSHSGNLGMLVNFLEREQDETARREILNMLRIATSNLEETTAHLTEVAAMDHSLQDNLRILDLRPIVNDALGNVQALLREAGGQCIHKLEDGLLVKAIPAYIDSAILNLLTNAIKYRSKDRHLRIEISSALEEQYVVLAVQDNGMGIDLSLYGHQIFGMYKTFHHHKDARGIGLFITRNQVEGMGGKVTVESIEGQGSTFRIYLKKA